MLRYSALWGLILTFLSGGLAQAQSLSAEFAITKVTIRGPGLAHPLTVRDSPALHILFDGGPPVDWSGGNPAIPRPSGLGRRYDITQYGTGSAVGWVSYYLDSAGRPGYFFYRSAAFGWSQAEYNHQWFHASAQVDHAIRRLLAMHGVHLTHNHGDRSYVLMKP